MSSPTIRVNGHDIADAVHESPCADCGDLCGCGEGTACRVWPYAGQEYTEAPVGLIVEAILNAATGEAPPEAPLFADVPDNLAAFYAGKARIEQSEAASVSSCCAPAVQATCCDSGDKVACCGPTQAPGSCGCQ